MSSAGAPLSFLTLLTSRHAIATTLVAVSIAITSRAYNNYRSWLSLGGGGVPYNFAGWLIQWILQLVSPGADSMLTTTEFSNSKVIAKYEPVGTNQFLARKLPLRLGDRPYVPAFFAPQRQVPANLPAMRKVQEEAMQRIAKANVDLVELRTSGLEGSAAIALWLKDPSALPSGARIKRALGETAHMHLHADGSCHAVLSLADAREVIDKGWGQKHLGSGGLILPHGYVMVYAPSTEEEVHVMEQILKAAVRFMSGGKQVH